MDAEAGISWSSTIPGEAPPTKSRLAGNIKQIIVTRYGWSQLGFPSTQITCIVTIFSNLGRNSIDRAPHCPKREFYSTCISPKTRNLEKQEGLSVRIPSNPPSTVSGRNPARPIFAAILSPALQLSERRAFIVTSFPPLAPFDRSLLVGFRAS